MGILFAIVFVILGVASLAVYGGTPHGGPTTTCGPINVMGHVFTVQADCRYVSAGEIAAGVVFLLLAAIAALSARPGR